MPCSTRRGRQGGGIDSGFEPAKALVGWLPLPLPRVLPVRLGPYHYATGGSRPVKRDPGWDAMLGGTNTIGRVVASSKAFYAG